MQRGIASEAPCNYIDPIEKASVLRRALQHQFRSGEGIIQCLSRCTMGNRSSTSSAVEVQYLHLCFESTGLDNELLSAGRR
jgi:hypothetical protein